MEIPVLRFTISEIKEILGIDSSRVSELFKSKQLVGFDCPKGVLRCTAGSLVSVINSGHFDNDQDRESAIAKVRAMMQGEL